MARSGEDSVWAAHSPEDFQQGQAAALRSARSLAYPERAFESNGRDPGLVPQAMSLPAILPPEQPQASVRQWAQEQPALREAPLEEVA